MEMNLERWKAWFKGLGPRLRRHRPQISERHKTRKNAAAEAQTNRVVVF